MLAKVATVRPCAFVGNEERIPFAGPCDALKVVACGKGEDRRLAGAGDVAAGRVDGDVEFGRPAFPGGVADREPSIGSQPCDAAQFPRRGCEAEDALPGVGNAELGVGG